MALEGIEALREFEERLPGLLADVERGDAGKAAAHLLAKHRTAMEAYAAATAAVIAWGIEAGHREVHRFDSSIVETGVRAALLAAYVPPVVELIVPQGDPAADGSGLRVVREAVATARHARLVGGEPADRIGLYDWTTKEGAALLAGVLATREPARAAKILETLPLAVQVRAVLAVSKMSLPDPELAKGLPRPVAELLLVESGERVEGVEKAARILEHLPSALAASILQDIARKDAEAACRVERRRVTFDSLLRVDDRGLQNVMKQIDNEHLALALKGATPELKGKFLRNMSRRASERIREEMEYMGPVRMADVEAAQAAIVDMVRRLERQGDVVLDSGGREMAP